LLRIKEVTLEERNLIIQEIFEQDVSVNVHYKPLPMLSYYKILDYNIDNYPVAKSLWECEISLPVYFSLSTSQTKEVVNAVINAVEKVKNND
jgi:dTDP-4-amino-4,6-dideoxygalactose transaminase